MITIFTPVYNRAGLLRRAYESLLAQTDTDFEWLVVDDGSTDDTPAELSRLTASHSGPFPMRVVTTPNGGKHRAVNRAVELARGEWFAILDSDDYLVPEAVAAIKRRIADLPADVAGVVALRVHPDGSTVGTPLPQGFETADLYYDDYRGRMAIEGDRMEVVLTEVMRRYPFPEFPGEKFLREGPVWQQIGTGRRMRYTNDAIYVCDYQADGLTAKVARLHDANPMGACWANAMGLRRKNIGMIRQIKLVAQWKRWSRSIADSRYLTPLPPSARKWLPLAPAVNLVRKLVK